MLVESLKYTELDCALVGVDGYSEKLVETDLASIGEVHVPIPFSDVYWLETGMLLKLAGIAVCTNIWSDVIPARTRKYS